MSDNGNYTNQIIQSNNVSVSAMGLGTEITETPLTEINRANMDIYKNYVKMELKRGKQEKEARMRKLRLDAQLERAKAKAIYDHRIKEIGCIQKQETAKINEWFENGREALMKYQAQMWLNVSNEYGI